MVESVRDLYRAWALKRLPGDEDNLAAFCNFLSTQAGAPLRLEGLVWIADALRSNSQDRYLDHAWTSSAFIEFLTSLITLDGAAAVGRPETRQALIDLVGMAVSKQLSAALALQDRLKGLL